MKITIFNTRVATKRDWHTGKTIFMKIPEGNEGLNRGSAGQIQVKRNLAQVASSQVWNNPRARAHITVNGKRMIVANLIVGKALAGHTYGGAENREAARIARHERTIAALSHSTGAAFTSTMGEEFPY